MKLYTEEQVREAIELAREGIRIYRVDEFETEKEFDHSEDDILTSLTPIELPSDDYCGVHLRHCYQREYEDCCKYGEDDCTAKPLETHKQQDNGTSN